MRRLSLLIAGIAVVCSSSFAAAPSPVADARSAFVRAHNASPVTWMPWGEAAFARAKAEQKPIYVFVGAYTQELARAMREQSFAREENAAMLNESFICVVVDRDEHPDVASFLQAYVTTVKQMQGWPLNVWLTPELQPFDGATYLPPSDEWGKEGFPNAIRRILTGWQTDPEAQRAKAAEATATLASVQAAGPADSVTPEAVAKIVDEGAAAWLATYDAANAGFGEPPRRLEPELLRALARRAADSGRDAALATLKAIVASPVRDPLDGGFFRSAADPAWRQPTLQKTLSDQARMALACQESALADAAVGALDYAASLKTSTGGFLDAEDGTAENVVPSYFWTLPEAKTVLGDTAAGLADALGITEAGNVPPDSYLGLDTTGRNLPRCAERPADDAGRAALSRLRAARAQRPQPAREAVAPSGAHGLLLAALASSPEARHREAAKQLAAWIRKELLLPEHRLRAGPGYTSAAGARDYAWVADGLLTFGKVSGDTSAQADAIALLASADTLYWDAAAARYLAVALPMPAGIEVRVPAPAPDSGDSGSADSVMLLVLSKHGVGDAARKAALAATIAAEIRDSGTPARGDQLLALQAWLASKP